MPTSAKTKIMVVDDDKQHLKDVSSHLEKQGYEVATAEDGHAALKLAKTMYPDLVVLDINFPDTIKAKNRAIDGVEVLRRLREEDNIPILMLSVSNIVSVKAMTFAIGADDYLSKPFDLQELSARISALLRRCRGESPMVEVLNFNRLRLDSGKRRVWKDGEPVDLTGIEFDILFAIARQPQYVFTREKLLKYAWKNESVCVPKAVDVHIGHIRKKVEDDPANPAFIVTVRGIGYRFEDATV